MLGTRIAMLRHAHGMNQQALAKELGVSASAVGMYEQGRREPPAAVIVRLSRLFSVSCDFLLTGECASDDLSALQGAYALALKKARGLRLRRKDGSEVAFDDEALALLFAALIG